MPDGSASVNPAAPPPDETIDAFRTRVEAFFAERAEPAVATGEWGVGPDDVVGSGLGADHDDPAEIEAARQFQKALFANGLAWITGPTELGGSGLTDEHVRVFREVARRFQTPDTSIFMIGQRIVAPAIAAYGSPEQQRRYLAGLWSGEIIGCQLFSEPDAGSDLASLRCRAVRDGDGWRISGQKVWSSGAHLATVGELLCRTDDDPSLRHRGLSMFLIDMDTPGVTVKTLRQMNGNSHFNEVFLDDVWVPADALLGPLGGGWQVANASLSSERDLDREDAGLFLDPVRRLLDLARHTGATDRPEIVQRLATADTHERISAWLPASVQSSPLAAPVAASLTKLFDAQAIWDVAQLAAEIAGAALTADSGAWGRYAWKDVIVGVHSQRIAGGTDEIQRNIIGERGLGLPREPRP